MGLVEGPGGLGQGGAAATLGEDSRDTEGKYEEYGYNAQLSDRISLDRSIPDYRPKKYVSYSLLKANPRFAFQALLSTPVFSPGALVRNVRDTGIVASSIHAAVDELYFCQGT